MDLLVEVMGSPWQKFVEKPVIGTVAADLNQAAVLENWQPAGLVQPAGRVAGNCGGDHHGSPTLPRAGGSLEKMGVSIWRGKPQERLAVGMSSIDLTEKSPSKGPKAAAGASALAFGRRRARKEPSTAPYHHPLWWAGKRRLFDTSYKSHDDMAVPWYIGGAARKWPSCGDQIVVAVDIAAVSGPAVY